MASSAWLLPYVAAAVAEIAGCFAFWKWARGDGGAAWLLPGIASLCLFAWLLARIDAPYAGRSFAAYGGIYILTALGWMWLVERARPDGWDLLGGGLSVAGAAVIVFAPRG